jgi:hypothetical protein
MKIRGIGGGIISRLLCSSLLQSTQNTVPVRHCAYRSIGKKSNKVII